jgi:Ca-activated chloride channel family protein
VNLYLEKPLFLLVIPIGVALVWLLVRQRIKVGFSQNELLTGMQHVPLYLVQKLLLSLAIGLLGIALAQPMRYTTTPIPVYVQARDIVVSLDISGSMASPVIESGSSVGKLELAKIVIEDFVMARPQDRIAIVAFDTRAYLEWPLSVDHRALLARLEQIKTTGGTQIGRGLIMALEQLALFGNQEGAVILLSDGESNLPPEEKGIIEFLLSQTHPHLYWIVIGDQNGPLTAQFRGYVEGWGGKVYQISPAELQEVFDEISQLESSPVVYEQNATARVEFGPLLFILAGVLALVSLLEITKEV